MCRVICIYTVCHVNIGFVIFLFSFYPLLLFFPKVLLIFTFPNVCCWCTGMSPLWDYHLLLLLLHVTMFFLLLVCLFFRCCYLFRLLHVRREVFFGWRGRGVAEVFLPPQRCKGFHAVWLTFVVKAAGTPGFYRTGEMKNLCIVTKPVVRKEQ